MNEQAVKLAARLYETRDTMRSICGDDYERRRNDYLPALRAAMERGHTTNPLDALVTIKRICAQHGDDVPVLCIAAAVDMADGVVS